MPSPRQMTPGIRWTLIVYGVTLLAAGLSGYGFSLHRYDGGGGLQHRCGDPLMDKGFPRGVDYAFFNHGDVTPISEEFYEHVRDADVVMGNMALVGFVGFAAAMIAYSIHLGLSGKGRDWEPAILLGALFLPRADDPFLTRAGKLNILLCTAVHWGWGDAMGTLFGVYPIPPDPCGVVSRVAETAFVEHVWRTLTVAVSLSLCLALVMPWVRRGIRRMVGGAQTA